MVIVLSALIRKAPIANTPNLASADCRLSGLVGNNAVHLLPVLFSIARRRLPKSHAS